MMNNSVNNSIFTKNLLDDFEVDSEDELADLLNSKADMSECIICGFEDRLENMEYPDGDPICKKCLKENGRF